MLTTKYCLSCSGHQSFSLKKFLKMCVKLFIPVFPIYFLLTTRLGVELNLFCFVQYEGSVKLCSKLCAFVNIIMVFLILCVNFIVCFWWLTLMKEFSLGLIFFLPELLLVFCCFWFNRWEKSANVLFINKQICKVLNVSVKQFISTIWRNILFILVCMYNYRWLF